MIKFIIFSSICDSPNEKLEHFSSYKRHFYRHDTVTRGICINSCEQQLNGNLQAKKAYQLPKFDIDSAIYHPGIEMHAHTPQHRIQYKQVINECVNQELINEYGLTSYSEIEYCSTKETESFTIDTLDSIALIIVTTLIVMLLWGTFYDIHLRSENTTNKNEHFRKYPAKSSRLLLAFSIPRNWNQLVNQPETNNSRPATDDFTFFESFKIIVMIGNTVVHIYSILSMIPSLNHEVLEINSQNTIHKIFSGSTFTNQIYLAIAGFLLTMAPAKQIKQGKVLNLSDFWDGLQKRYLRLTPLHAFAILIEATWVSKLYNGPIWQQIAGQDRASCRANWWTNLLYINNFIGADEPCILPTWYLATDMQLFIMRFIFLAIISRFPKRKSIFFALAIIITFIIPAYIVHVHQLDGVYVGNVEAARYFFRHEIAYKSFHIPFHVSMGSYVFGMLTAFIYREVKDENIDVTKSGVFMFLWNMTVPMILFGIFGAPYIFSTFEFEKPSWWITIYGAIHRNMWGLLLGVIILGFNRGMGGQWKDFFNSSVFRPLGKINFGFYLTHITMIKLVLGDAYHPHFISLTKFIWLVISITFISYITGAIAHLLVELPAANLQKEWQSKPTALPSNGVNSNGVQNNLITKQENGVNLNLSNNNNVDKKEN
uniref:CSON009110 protein n=1 Tax=Culicoides sonorensis TaxID=179676 RepID=A0A336LZH1_CULSO